MKYVLLALVLAAGALAAPSGDAKACDSEICRALKDFNDNLPGYMDQMEGQVCTLIDNSIFKDFCTRLFDKYKPQLIQLIQQQLNQQASAFGCDLSGQTVYKPRDDCSDSLYCQQLGQIYNDLPQYIDQLEGSLCGELPQQLQKVCTVVIDLYKNDLVDLFRQQIVQQATPAGCKFGEQPTAAPAA